MEALAGSPDGVTDILPLRVDENASGDMLLVAEDDAETDAISPDREGESDVVHDSDKDGRDDERCGDSESEALRDTETLVRVMACVAVVVALREANSIVVDVVYVGVSDFVVVVHLPYSTA